VWAELARQVADGELAGWAEVTPSEVAIARSHASAWARVVDSGAEYGQGLTLVHSSAQLERLLCDTGCSWWLFRGCLGGGTSIRGVLGVILCQKRLKLS